jgi:hypothetical protein
MNKTCFFFQQTSRRKTPKRYRKTPDELPQSLRFAHLNPKVAAYLASKENKLKDPDDSDFTDGSFLLGFDSVDESAQGIVRKSLLPEISEAVSNVKTQLYAVDSTFEVPVDEHLQRLIFEESKLTLPNILFQLERLLRQIEFECIRIHIPRGIEHRLLQGYKELSSEAIYIYREWQTPEAKAAHEKEMAKRNEEEKTTDKDSSVSVIDGDSGKHDKDDHQKRRKSTKSKMQQNKLSLHDISEDEEISSDNVGQSTDSLPLPGHRKYERSGSVTSVHHSSLGLKKTRLEKFRGLHDGVHVCGLSTSRSSCKYRPSFAIIHTFLMAGKSANLILIINISWSAFIFSLYICWFSFTIICHFILVVYYFTIVLN